MIYKHTPRSSMHVSFSLSPNILWLSLAVQRGLVRSDALELKGEFCQGIYFGKEISVRP